MPEQQPPPEAGFLQRWSKLKHQAGQAQDNTSPATAPESPVTAPLRADDVPDEADPASVAVVSSAEAVDPSASVKPEGVATVTTAPHPLQKGQQAAVQQKAFAELTDADMPPLASLGDDSDYRLFMAPGVSAGLRNQALRRLFSQPHFNRLDGLDDYAGDYTTFEPLGALVTTDLKHRLQRQAQAQLQQLLDHNRTGMQQLAEARMQTLEALQQRPQAIAGMVGYQSAGQVLVIGDRQALAVATRLQAPLSPRVVLTDGPVSGALAASAGPLAQTVIPLAGRRLQVSGYLGAFEVTLEAAETTGTTETATMLQADLVLDLQPAPALVRGILPPGYFAPGPETLEAALTDLVQLTGQFSK
ncbi:MAG: DUF3306 domain-containing protein, partial [Thiothrix sp.]|nr:DUF3306 domain-containing protein [Thiothrix sp.]